MEDGTKGLVRKIDEPFPRDAGNVLSEGIKPGHLIHSTF